MTSQPAAAAAVAAAEAAATAAAVAAAAPAYINENLSPTHHSNCCYDRAKIS